MSKQLPARYAGRAILTIFLVAAVGLGLVAGFFIDVLLTSYIHPTYIERATHARQNGQNVDHVCFRDKRIVLIGDSTMARAAIAFAEFLNCTLVREGSRCDFEAYYGDAVKNSTHSAPIPKTYGPFGYGSVNRGCMDCSGCHPKKWYCGVANMTVELIGMEFARDVEYPTAFGETTQESIIRGYMAREYNVAPYAVVFNTGMHDLAISPTKTTPASEMYEVNLDWLTWLLSDSFQTRGSKLLWTSTSEIVPETQNPKYRSITANNKITQYNRAAERVMRKWNVPVYDVLPLTRQPEIKALCLDGIHYGTPSQLYYRFVAFSIALKLCAAQL